MIRLHWLAGVLLTLATLAFAQEHRHRASPFEALRWRSDRPLVQVSGTWYRPLAIGALDVDEILAESDRRWPGMRRKRFAEDLMEIMARLGAEPGDRVTLRVARLTDGVEVTLPDVPNTEENRRRLHAANTGRSSMVVPHTLTREDALADLEAFAAGLEARFAYYRLRDVDWDGELARIADELSEETHPQALADHLHVLLLRAGDAHARVRGPDAPLGRRGPFLPFLLADSSVGVVAFGEDRERFLDPAHPVVTALAGVPLADCLAAVRPNVTDGSPQLVRRRALRLLRDASLWLPAVAGGSVPGSLEVELLDPATGATRTREVALRAHEPTSSAWPRGGSQRLAGDIGYLRLAQMDAEAVEEVHRWMPRLKDTRGLVVDVRGNGGGSREALLALAGYLIGPDQGPWVGNVAALRLAPGAEECALEDRFLFPHDHASWSPAQRAAVEELRATFAPEWPLPEGFGDWHYLVLDRTGAAVEFPYAGEVVVLSDAHCFSATDVFLGALERHPRVTLVGAASSGGSARSRSFTLPRSGITVRCASMASFRPDGRLYDGRGVEVDVGVEVLPTDHLRGGTDTTLAAAVRLLSR